MVPTWHSGSETAPDRCCCRYAQGPPDGVQTDPATTTDDKCARWKVPPQRLSEKSSTSVACWCGFIDIWDDMSWHDNMCKNVKYNDIWCDIFIIYSMWILGQDADISKDTTVWQVPLTYQLLLTHGVSRGRILRCFHFTLFFSRSFDHLESFDIIWSRFEVWFERLIKSHLLNFQELLFKLVLILVCFNPSLIRLNRGRPLRHGLLADHGGGSLWQPWSAKVSNLCVWRFRRFWILPHLAFSLSSHQPSTPVFWGFYF